MALNWDKLERHRRENPKPKPAFDACKRLLKKRPADPYLLAWQADTSLALRQNSDRILSELLMPLCNRKDPLDDSRLLGYIYEMILEATRIQNPLKLDLASAGEQALKAWSNAAKLKTKTRKAKLDYWSSLFVISMKEDCWEDVRWSVTQALQEGPTYRKRAVFSLILANQLSYERKLEGRLAASPAVEIQKRVALNKMVLAFENTWKSPNDPVRVENMGDLRFMAQIFARQKLATEFATRINQAPESVQNILEAHKTEFTEILSTMYTAEKKWQELYDMMMKCVEEGYTRELERQNVPGNWLIWGNMLRALSYLHPRTEAAAIASQEILPKLAKYGSPGRNPNLIRIAIASFAGVDTLLQFIKDYWTKYKHLKSCFADLQKFVERLSRTQQVEFLKFASGLDQESGKLRDKSEGAAERWLLEEINITKFNYMLSISPLFSKSEDHIRLTEQFVANAMSLYGISIGLAVDSYDLGWEAGWLATYGLLKIQDFRQSPALETQENNSAKNAEDTNVQGLIQAGISSLYFTSSEAGKRNRTMMLLSTRLHMLLGLGSIAYQQYRYAILKEMLQDTLSYHLLSRISQHHPFDCKLHLSNEEFCPEDELRKVISIINKMGDRAGDFVYADMEKFKYEQCFELLEFRQKTKCSLTKHLALLELRRIQRLKDAPPTDVEMTLGECRNISDNRDLDVLPNYGPTYAGQPQWLFDYPSKDWLLDYYELQDRAFNLTFQEDRSYQISNLMVEASKLRGPIEIREHHGNKIEKSMAWSWYYTTKAAVELYNPIQANPNMGEIQRFLEKLRDHFTLAKNKFETWYNVPAKGRDVDETKSESRSLLPTEELLEFYFGELELLKLNSKLCARVEEILLPDKGKKGKKQALELPFWVRDFNLAVAECYEAIRISAESYIAALKDRGVENVLGHARAGISGQALAKMIPSHQLVGYAKMYVDSAIDALEGVLKVKIEWRGR
ncbi:N-acetyltransferase B complex non catalytic subunit-domain-containing protein [Clohesyomyces aquaticus]|uniref:N-acetyltransferase B complex non catalytic subunit-domain-containing protein n=1 Tax=Clohesyomyces aquaticus TaxID=1231657 RepID=A0A1Y1YPR8_9PLEO|nr:N-acetyltransferase B complex non catalytic subunit-domain-containing protein [Clohesyomyces aquaticus]